MGVVGAIRYSGLGVRSVGPVGDFLETYRGPYEWLVISYRSEISPQLRLGIWADADVRNHFGKAED